MTIKPRAVSVIFWGLLALASSPAKANLTVFACEPEWASLVATFLPEAKITTATTAWQDPHYIEARPSLIAAMRTADLAVCTGASLEAGWLPSLLSRAANPAIQPGRDGLFFAAEHAVLHQNHQHTDRSHGDVHPEGDPHFHLAPDVVPQVAGALAQRLRQLAPGQHSDIQRRYLRWRAQWNLKREQWRSAAEYLDGTSVITQHSTFDYLLRWLGVAMVADLEPKPGLPPSSQQLRNLLATPELARTDLILIASHQNERPAKWLSERSAVPLAILPGTVTGATGQQSLADIIDLVVETLREHMESQHVE